MAMTSQLAEVCSVVEDVFSIILAQGDADYIGEPVSQLEHCLQCAALAQATNADEETIVAALLHDIGRFIPASEKMTNYIQKGKYLGRGSHDALGERYLRRLGFSERICQLVGAHVAAKRYLCATEIDYWDSLSPTSKKTLEYQGGRFNEEQISMAQKDPWLQEKLALRRWDDFAKVPKRETPTLESYKQMIFKCLLDARSSITLHGRRYGLPKSPTVIICVDGLDLNYFESCLSEGSLSNLGKLTRQGFQTIAKAIEPSAGDSEHHLFLNGADPSSRDFAYEAVLNTLGDHKSDHSQANQFGNSNLLSLLSRRGVRVGAMIQDEDLVLETDSNGLLKSSALSARINSVEADSDNNVWVEDPSKDTALSVLDIGFKLLETQAEEVLYLAISAPCHRQSALESGNKAEAFWREIDAQIKCFADLGAIVAITAYQRQRGLAADGKAEQNVPLISSRPLREPKAATERIWNNYDVFDLALNWS